MSVIHAENFDGSSSLPSGWSATGTWSIKGSPYPAGVSPTSTPNMLQGSASSGAIWFTYGTADPAGGNLTVQVNAITSSMGTPGIVGVSARGSAATLTSATTQYTAWFDSSTGEVGISKWSGGVKSDLATMTPVSAPTGWGQLSATLNGTALSLSLRDLGSGNWLNAAGGWQSSQATALSATDASLSGSGYYGTYASPSYGAFTPYFDDLTASSSGGGSGQAGTIGATGAHDAGSAAGSFATAAHAAAAERADSGAIAGQVETAILTVQESPDVPTITGVFTAKATLARLEYADSPGMLAAVRAAAMAALERRDAGSIAASFAARAAAAVVEHGDSGAIVATVHNATTLAAAEARDVGSIAASAKAIATLSATERGDSGAIVGATTLVGILAAAEAGDRGVIAVVAAAPPPYFKVKEAGDVARILGGSPTLHYNVYASPLPGEPIDYSAPVAVVAGLSWTSGPLSIPGAWSFGVRAANAAGEEQNLDCAVTVLFDAAGDDITNVPSPPVNLRAIPEAGGVIAVIWGATPATGAKAATGFRVYAGTNGLPDYAAPVATVAANAAVVGAYRATFTGIDATRYVVGVRAYNATGEEQNEATVTVTADATPPLDVSGPTLTFIT